jgi:RecG-like helicase
VARVPPARSKRPESANKPAKAIEPVAAGTEAIELQDLPIEQLKGVGAQAAAIFRLRGIETAGDLLARAPVRYLDLRHADDWALARDDVAGALVALTAIVADARRIGHPRRGGLALSLRDPAGTTTLRAVFFHAPPGLHERATPGNSVRVIGTLRVGSNGTELVHPRLLAPGTRNAPIEPVYTPIGALAASAWTRGATRCRARRRTPWG